MAIKRIIGRTDSRIVFPGNQAYLSLLFIEVKRPGRKPTPLQATVMEELKGYGARCFVATNIEDVEDMISEMRQT